VVGRMHVRYAEPEGRRQWVTRLVWGAARGDGSIIPVRTVEYATSLRSDFTPVSFKQLSSKSGRLTLAFRGERLALTTDLEAKELLLSEGLAALPWAPDDLGLLAVRAAKGDLQPGSSQRLELRDISTGALQTPLVQVFVDAKRAMVLQLPSGKATFALDGWVQTYEARSGRTYTRHAQVGSAPELLPTPSPLRYERPAQAGWRDRDVLIDVQGAQLAGSLSVPRSTSQWPSNLAPAVVFISDLDAQNRHGHTPAIDYGTWKILDALAEAGFAVLRLDDRGVDGSRINSATVKDDLQTALDDTVACLDFLKRQPSVDPDRVFVIGHGFGARVAAQVAAQQALTGLVLLAPAYRGVSEVMAEPMVQIAEADPARSELQMRQVLQALAGNAAAQAQAPSQAVAQYRPFGVRLLSYAEQDLAQVVAEIEEPVAVFQGMRDFEVSWMHDAKALVDGLNKRRRRQAKLFIYELVDHHMKTESTRSRPERYLDRSRAVDSDVLRDLKAWMRTKALGNR